MQNVNDHRTGRAALLIAVVAVLGLVIAAIAVSAGHTPLSTEPGSPEAVVQDYFDALLDRRREAALATFTEELAEDCDAALTEQWEFRRAGRIVLDDTTTEARSASVVVRITEVFDGGLLDSGESTFSETITLTRTDDGWRISSPPWPLYSCSAVPK